MLNYIINILLFFTLLPVDGLCETQAQQSDIQGVIKLAKYASWPADRKDKTIIMIAPQSDETFQQALDNAANSRILDKEVEIRRISSIDEALCQADIIFMSGRQILTITNDVDILEQGCMFYVKQDHDTGQTIYFYNKDAVLTSPLGISSHILAPDHKYQKK